ncbi:serine/threonine-protein kinase [Kitasatospora sp. NPDC094015]|uniref:serine/threonine-protein kinase n=1 Tax=Kitasatospora sp. NPDC094015 TaxID=3155205 RepID=UPI0033333292
MGGQDQSAGVGTGRLLAGRYALGERLGRGGMGTVWRARDEMLDRDVAVKELTVSHLSEEDLEILQTRMKREARAAARIKHPGVITIHDVLEQDGRPWIVMELVDGRSLADVISQDGELRPQEAAEVGVQVLAALHRGHQLGVLHRDVKPANVLLEHNTGRVVLLDFGIAKFEGAGAVELTRPGDLVGSPDYLAPERAQGERPGPASDLWALGATLWAAVEGKSPFRRDSPLSTLTAVVEEPLPESAKAGALGPVLAALMAKDPEQRPGADEALRMLTEVVAGHTVGIRARVPEQIPTGLVPVVDRTQDGPPAPVDPTGPTGPTVPVQHQAAAPTPVASAPVAPAAPRRRRRLRFVLIALVTAALVGGGAYVVLEHQGAGEDTPSGPDPTPTGLAAPDPAPAGYQWVDDPAGFRFLLPSTGGTWVRSVDNSEIYYSPDAKVHYLQFAVTVGQSLSPLQHFQEMEQSVNKNRQGYKREQLAEIKVNGFPGAVWEFSYTTADNSGTRRYLKEAEFKTGSGTSYDVLSAGPDKDRIDSQKRFTTVLNHFTVLG